MKALFIHGGPGLNSQPEKKLLKNIYDNNGLELILWNEPKETPPEDSYNFIVKSLIDCVKKEGPELRVVAHSVGCRTLLEALPSIEEYIKGIIFVSPVIDLIKADRDIIRFSIEKFKYQSNIQKAMSLQKKLDSLTDSFDQLRISALVECFESNYFIDNFKNLQSFENYFSKLTEEHSFRLEDFFKIRRSIIKRKPELNQKSTIPMVSYFGKNDPIVRLEDNQEILDSYFSNALSFELQDVSHYSHIDEVQVLIKSLKLFK